MIKQIFFWLTVIPLAVVMIAVGLIHTVVSAIFNHYTIFLSRYEGWCFNYKRNGYTWVPFTNDDGGKNGYWRSPSFSQFLEKRSDNTDLEYEGDITEHGQHNYGDR